MKNATLSVLLLAMLGAGVLIGSWYRPRETVSAASARPRMVRYYVDPMHPSYTSDRPGVAPDCGMALQPVYDEDAPARTGDRADVAGAVAVTPKQQELIGVRVATVESGTAARRVRLYGHVVPDEGRTWRINVGIDGFVREVSGAATGSLVRKDEWLATFTAPEARGAIQGYLVSLDVVERANQAAESAAAVEFANAALQQTADRLLALGMSATQIATIRKSRQVPSAIEIAAPEAGFVIARNVSVGQKLERGDELYRLADLGHVWIVADVSGADAAYIGPGATAAIVVPGRGTTLHGRVSRAPTQFNAASQSVALRIDVDNPGLILRPEMFVDVYVDIALPRSIAIPAGAVVDSGLTKSVFVERAAGLFEPRRVDTGWRFGGRVEIVNGLRAGERIAVEGAFLLDAEGRIRGSTSEPGSRP